MRILIEIFKGNYSLVKTFWLVNILGNLVTGALIDFKANSTNVILFFVIYILYFVYSFISTWNSSTRYIAFQKKNYHSPFWGYLAKIIIILLIYFPVEWYFVVFL